MGGKHKGLLFPKKSFLVLFSQPKPKTFLFCHLFSFHKANFESLQPGNLSQLMLITHYIANWPKINGILVMRLKLELSDCECNALTNYTENVHPPLKKATSLLQSSKTRLFLKDQLPISAEISEHHLPRLIVQNSYN